MLRKQQLGGFLKKDFVIIQMNWNTPACGILSLGNKEPLRIDPSQSPEDNCCVVSHFGDQLGGSASTALFVRHQRPTRRLERTVGDVERAAPHPTTPHPTTNFNHCLRTSQESCVGSALAVDPTQQVPEPLLDRVQSICRHVSTAVL